MAIVTMNYQIQDRKGLSSNVKIRVPQEFTLDQYLEAAADFGQLLASVVRGEVVSSTIGIGVDISGLTSNILAAEDVDVEEGAIFSFRTGVDPGGFPMILRVATFDEAFIVDGTREVDLTDIDVAAFVDAIVNGIIVTADAGDTLPIIDSREFEIGQLDKALESFQPSRKIVR
jgi:hypothetical protein